MSNYKFNQNIFTQMHQINEEIRILLNQANRTTFTLDEVDRSALRANELKMKFLAKGYPIEWKTFQQRVKEPPSLS